MQDIYAVFVSDFLSGSIGSVQLDVAYVKNRLGVYSPWSWAESHLWDDIWVFALMVYVNDQSWINQWINPKLWLFGLYKICSKHERMVELWTLKFSTIKQCEFCVSTVLHMFCSDTFS